MLHFKKDRGHYLMGNRMRFDNQDKVREDLGWISGLTNDEKLLLTNNKLLVQLYKNFGYALS